MIIDAYLIYSMIVKWYFYEVIDTISYLKNIWVPIKKKPSPATENSIWSCIGQLACLGNTTTTSNMLLLSIVVKMIILKET